MSAANVSSANRFAPVQSWLPALVLVMMGVAALAFGLNNLLIPTQAQAASDAALAGKEYLNLLHSFDRNPLLIRTHVALGVVFNLLVLFQFWRGFRNADLRRHRIIGYVEMTCLVLLPVTAVACTFVYPFAGPSGVPPNVLWTIAILTCVTAAWRAIKRKDVAGHEIWITRASAMTVGISLTRLYEPVFVHAFHMIPHVAFGLTFWLGQGEGLAIAEFWLRRPGGPIQRKTEMAARAAARA